MRKERVPGPQSLGSHCVWSRIDHRCLQGPVCSLFWKSKASFLRIIISEVRGKLCVLNLSRQFQWWARIGNVWLRNLPPSMFFESADLPYQNLHVSKIPEDSWAHRSWENAGFDLWCHDFDENITYLDIVLGPNLNTCFSFCLIFEIKIT